MPAPVLRLIHRTYATLDFSSLLPKSIPLLYFLLLLPLLFSLFTPSLLSSSPLSSLSSSHVTSLLSISLVFSSFHFLKIRFQSYWLCLLISGRLFYGFDVIAQIKVSLALSLTLSLFYPISLSRQLFFSLSFCFTSLYIPVYPYLGAR